MRVWRCSTAQRKGVENDRHRPGRAHSSWEEQPGQVFVIGGANTTTNAMVITVLSTTDGRILTTTTIPSAGSGSVALDDVRHVVRSVVLLGGISR